MARAKCQWCKNEIDTKTAHREVVDGKNKYWCNDNCYRAYEKEREKQTKLKAWLSGVMSKEFASDFNRGRYFSAIVAGKLHDWKPKVVEPYKSVQPKAVETTFYEIGDVVRKPTRRAMADVEDKI